MIQNKKDLAFYIQEDKKRNLGNIGWKDYWAKKIYSTDNMKAFIYLRTLRRYEYAKNCLYKNVL